MKKTHIIAVYNWLTDRPRTLAEIGLEIDTYVEEEKRRTGVVNLTFNLDFNMTNNEGK